MLTTLGQMLVSGLAFGAVYALIAIAFALIYRSTRTINFAQGHLAMIGAYVTLWAMESLALPYALAAVVGIVAVVIASIVVEIVAFRPLYRFGGVLVIVSSIALTFVIETILLLGWGAQSIRLDAIVDGTFQAGPIIVSWQQVIVVIGMIVSVVVLNLLLASRIGRAMRAAAESREVAGLFGIRGKSMITFSFALAGALTGVAGILVAPLTYLEPNSGATLGLLGVVAAIVGGLGNLTGAVVGGFTIGLANIVGAYFIGGSFVETATFIILVLMLLIRPQGLFGEEGVAVRA